MRTLRNLALGIALSGPLAAGEVAVPLADGSVLRGERVDDPEVAARGIRLRTGGITVFVPWEEIDPEARGILSSGGSPPVPLTSPPLAPGPGEDIPDPVPAAPMPSPPPETLSWEPGKPPPLPECLDPRF
ncbi:MAG: hypothetical protein HUU15_01435 [Candidatus Brocadiae bacterium]|nr:hypothetical protein [Candidatus Brocadiia bacterium]